MTALQRRDRRNRPVRTRMPGGVGGGSSSLPSTLVRPRAWTRYALASVPTDAGCSSPCLVRSRLYGAFYRLCWSGRQGHCLPSTLTLLGFQVTVNSLQIVIEPCRVGLSNGTDFFDNGVLPRHARSPKVVPGYKSPGAHSLAPGIHLQCHCGWPRSQDGCSSR